jgi:hypothetical protein
MPEHHTLPCPPSETSATGLRPIGASSPHYKYKDTIPRSEYQFTRQLTKRPTLYEASAGQGPVLEVPLGKREIL